MSKPKIPTPKVPHLSGGGMVGGSSGPDLAISILSGGGGDDDLDSGVHPMILAGRDLIDAVNRGDAEGVAAALSAAQDIHASYPYDPDTDDDDGDEGDGY